MRRHTGKIAVTGLAAAILVLAVIGTVALSGGNHVRRQGLWSDATDVLSGQAAAGADRAARAPYINTEQGNMLAFFFTLGGVAAGLIIGYSWRRLLGGRPGAGGSSPRLVAGALLAAAALAAAGVHAFARPLLDPALGDVVLFVFALAGAVGGVTTGSGLGSAPASEERRPAA